MLSWMKFILYHKRKHWLVSYLLVSINNFADSIIKCSRFIGLHWTFSLPFDICAQFPRLYHWAIAFIPILPSKYYAQWFLAILLCIASELFFISPKYLTNGFASTILEAILIGLRLLNFIVNILIFIGRISIEEFEQKTLFLTFHLQA